MTIDPTNRTFIGSVVFVDIVGYSKKSVVEQMATKDRFTARLGEALKDIDVSERIVLDTGDGAAMSFLGDPEDALFVGLSLREIGKGDAPGPDGGGANEDGSIRIGINLGPVRLVKDINGHPNIVGDGINVAQRIMSFAQPGQVLVSRSFYDVVSCLSEEYAKLFSYDGSRTDKHVREHEVYVVGESETAFKQAKTGMAHRAAQTNPPALKAGTSAGDARAAQTRWSSTAAIKETAMAFLQDRRKVMISGGVLGAIVLLLAVLLVARKPAPPAVQTAAAAVASAPAEASAQGAAAETNPMAGAAAQPAAQPASAKPKPEAKKTVAPKSEVAQGTVNLAVAPWGEVYVNGKSRGISPPMKTLILPPGKYRIEIRNTAFAPHTEVLQVKAREEVTIRHVFK
jgi:class 3 adenylate cyclase